MRGFICRDCKNHFVQEPRCVTCGAEKLYDATTRYQAKEIDRLRAENARLREALEDIARGDYSDPIGRRTPEDRARAALKDTQP